MHAILTIAKKEFNTFFDSLIAYLLLVIFLVLAGIFTWLYGNDIFVSGQASLRNFFQLTSLLFLFFIPAITMRMLAEERNTGTIELLLTKAVSDREVILGKFLACLGLVLVALLFTLPYYITVASLGNIDHGATICGYLGLILVSMAYIGIGLFASSITNNQIIAFLLAFVICIFFHFMFGFFSNFTSGFIGSILQTLSVDYHFQSISRGVIDTKDIIYFLSLSGLGILLSEISISNRG